MRIVYIQATLVPPPPSGVGDRFLPLSEHLEGDILQPSWFRTTKDVEDNFGAGAYPVHVVGRFRYHWFLGFRGARMKNRLAVFWFYLKEGFKLCREKKVDCIVVYSHMTTALCGVILKLLTGTKLITEVMNSPERAYLKDRPIPRVVDKLQHAYSTFCLHITVLASDRVHLLYPAQLSHFPVLRSKPASVFHDYTHVSRIQRHKESDEGLYVILAGAPWFLKGADLAVKAFSRLAADFPNARLKIVGHFPEGTRERECEGNPQIEVLKALPHAGMMQMLSGAGVMLLPSRSEGLPRILIEGMMAGLPLIGSAVGGIPTLIQDGENGFIVPEGDTELLEQRLRQLLASPELRRKMGQKSYERAQATLTEAAYTENFVRMLRDTVGPY